MKTLIVISRVVFVPLCVGFVLTLVASAGTQLYMQAKRDTDNVKTATDLVKSFRSTDTYGAYMTVHSYDAETRTLLVFVHSILIKQAVPTLVHLTEDFAVMRRDAIVMNGAVIGNKPTVPASTTDLVQGTHGYGFVQLDSEGKLHSNFLLIGDPYPRP